MSHIIIGTAGHIDHGKTSLTKALTGVETDRLKEEKLRGLTIDLGFAHWDDWATIIDVPGHERFIRNMVAGVSAIDLAMLIIAADDGVMPQTREHLEILKILQIKRGIVVVTKMDLVENDWLDLVQDEIKTLVANTFLEKSKRFAVSSITGEGIPALAEYISEFAKAYHRSPNMKPFWMPVDRSFTMKGFGAVLTGSALSGSLENGQVIEILPQQIKTKVRGLQSHDKTTSKVSVGNRVAINLQGVNSRLIGRGSVVALPSTATPSQHFFARLDLLKTCAKPIKTDVRARLHIGTAEVMARVGVFNRSKIMPGESGYVRLTLERPSVSRRLEPFVLRQFSPPVTIGGGVILHANAPACKLSDKNIVHELIALEQQDPLEALEAKLLSAGQQMQSAENLSAELALALENTLQMLSALHDAKKIILVKKGKKSNAIHTHIVMELQQRAIERLNKHHKENPEKPGMRKGEFAGELSIKDDLVTDIILGALQEAGDIIEKNDIICKRDHQIALSSEKENLKRQLKQILFETGFATPSIKDLAQSLKRSETEISQVLQIMIHLEEAIRLEGEIYFCMDRVNEAKALLREYLNKNGEIKISGFKRLLKDTSRKYAMPLLNFFDASGLTLRDGDARILADSE